MTPLAERCAKLMAKDFPQGGTWTANDIQNIISRSGGHVFENDGGFLVAQSVVDEAEIWTLVVARDKRRQGYARDLVESAAKALGDMGIRSIFLEVAADNQAALALYQSCGFLEIARRKGYYPREAAPAQDAIVMRLSRI